MALIFISHSSRDNQIVTTVAKQLKDGGFDSIFLDFDETEGILAGEEWEKRLYSEIKRSHAVIVILSQNWLDSKWCFAEYTQARALGKEILPLLVDPNAQKSQVRHIASNLQHSDLNKNPHALQLIIKRLRQITLETQKGFSWDPRRPPYPGLVSFEEEDAAIFFGRDKEIRMAIEYLNSMRNQGNPKLLHIIAASGMGKSSLLKAGILPHIKLAYKQQWIVLPTLRPQKRPLYSLLYSLCSDIDLEKSEELYRELQGEHYKALIDKLLLKVLQKSRGSATRASILLPIDQAEEFYTLAKREESVRFFEILEYCFEQRGDFFSIWTQRSDFINIFQSDQAAIQLVGQEKIFELTPIEKEEIPKIIRGPAAVAALSVESALIDKIVEDVKDTKALPFLAMVLHELYVRYGKNGNLQLSEYLSLGDQTHNPIENIVKLKADSVVAPFLKRRDGLKLLKETFIPHLVQINEKNEAVRRTAQESELPAKSKLVINALVDARLLVKRLSKSGENSIEIAHDALISKWPRLNSWIQEEHEFLIGKANLESAMREWEETESSKKRDALLSGIRLEKALFWLKDHSWAISEREKSFIIESQNYTLAIKRKRKRQAIAAFIAITLLMILSLYKWVEANGAKNIAEQNRHLAVNNLYKSLINQGITQRDYFHRPLKAKLLFAQAMSQSQSTQEQKKTNILDNSLLYPYKLEKFYRSESPVSGAIFDKNETKILSWSSSGIIELRDVASGKVLQCFKHVAAVRGAAFDKNESRVLSWSYDNTIRVWSIASGKQLILLKHTKEPRGARFDANESRILSWGEDGKVILWSAKDGRKIREFQHERRVRSACFSQDESKILSWSWDGTSRIWETSSGRVLHIFRHSKNVIGAQLNADESHLLSWSGDGNITLWDVESNATIGSLIASSAAVSGAVFSSDEKRVLCWSRHDGTILIWDPYQERVLHPYLHPSVWGATFDTNESRILSWGWDGTVRVWNINKYSAKHIFYHKKKVWGATFNHNESRVLSWSEDGTAKVWSFFHKDAVEIFSHQPNEETAALYSKREDRVLTWSRDKAIKVWDVNNSLETTSLQVPSKINGLTSYKEPEELLAWGTNGGLFLGDWKALKRFDANGTVLGASLDYNRSHLLTWSSNGEVLLYDVKSAHLLSSIYHKGGAYGAQFIDASRVVSFGEDGVMNVWSFDGKLLYKFKHTSPIIGINIDSNISFLLAWTKDGTLKLLNLKDYSQLASYRVCSSINGAIFDSNSSRVLSWDDSGTLSLWDIASGQKMKALHHDGSINGAKFMRKEKEILSWSNDGTVRMWDIERGVELARFRHQGAVNGATLDKKEQNLLSWGDDGKIKLWSIEKKKLLKSYSNKDDVWGVSFNKDESLLLSWGAGGDVVLWDRQSGYKLWKIEHQAAVYGALFDASEQFVYSWGESKTIHKERVFLEKSPASKEKILQTYMNKGVALSEDGEVRTLSKEEWFAKKALLKGAE